MKKELVFTFIASFTLIASFMLVQDVKAYEETAFIHETCITNDTWIENAKTEYKLNNDAGIYETSGETYENYIASGKTDKHVFYVTSDNGKVLHAFVPNFGKVTSTENIQAEIQNAGINSAANCKETETLTVNKTVLGNPPTSDTYYEEYGATDSTSSSPSDQETPEVTEQDNKSKNDEENLKVDPNEEGSDKEITKIESPNTASPMTITAIILSILFVGVAIYSYIKRANPELLEKFKIRK